MKMYILLKRLFDELFALFVLIILFPVFLVISALIKFEDGGKVLYTQNRVGKDGKPLKIYKFRTMKENADNLEDFLSPEELAEYKINYKLDNDKRITRIGKILRKTSLDELPQFINVLKGEMSLIGPRPILQEETELYGNDKGRLLSVKPGITGYWQAYARNKVGYEDHKRQDMELYYVNNRSLFLDIKILFKTVGTVISGSGAK